jgi:hypothetical protein
MNKFVTSINSETALFQQCYNNVNLAIEKAKRNTLDMDTYMCAQASFNIMNEFNNDDVSYRNEFHVINELFNTFKTVLKSEECTFIEI